jgi:hypothetical protein
MICSKRSGFAFLSLMTLLMLCLLPSCKQTAITTNAREDLVRALGNTNLSGFDFESTENDAQLITSFTNSNVKSVIRLEGGTNSVVLKYTGVKDKGKNTSTTYKTELSRSGNTLAMLVTDLASGAIVSRDTFPPPTSHDPVGPTFDSLEDCINDFDCKRKGALQCEANRTCKDQFAALTCCLKNGECYSVHLIIRPTRILCQLLPPWITDFKAAVFRNPVN